MTSFTAQRLRSTATISAQAAPTAVPTSRESGISTIPMWMGTRIATAPEPSAPITSCPSAPML